MQKQLWAETLLSVVFPIYKLVTLTSLFPEYHVMCHVTSYIIFHRMLSELTHQVETSTREVSQLQAKLEQSHSMRAEEQAQRAKIHQEQLKSKLVLASSFCRNFH